MQNRIVHRADDAKGGKRRADRAQSHLLRHDAVDNETADENVTPRADLGAAGDVREGGRRDDPADARCVGNRNRIRAFRSIGVERGDRKSVGDSFFEIGDGGGVGGYFRGRVIRLCDRAVVDAITGDIGLLVDVPSEGNGQSLSDGGEEREQSAEEEAGGDFRTNEVYHNYHKAGLVPPHGIAWESRQIAFG